MKRENQRRFHGTCFYLLEVYAYGQRKSSRGGKEKILPEETMEKYEDAPPVVADGASGCDLLYTVSLLPDVWNDHRAV